MRRTVKTAIFIEQPVFEEMDGIAKDLKVSRSRLFSLAAQEFIQRRKKVEILDRINAAYEDQPESEPIISKMHFIHRRIIKDQWQFAKDVFSTSMSMIDSV